jgi:twitching motility protein PilT
LQLASVTKAIISQRLARRKDKQGFVPAVEVLIVNQRVREMIEDKQKTKELLGAIEESKETMGMQSFDQGIMELLQKDLIDFDEAMRLSSNPEDFALKYSGVNSGGAQWGPAASSGLQRKHKSEWEGIQGLEIEGVKKNKEGNG